MKKVRITVSDFMFEILVVCQIVLIKKFRLWPDRIKRIFKN